MTLHAVIRQAAVWLFRVLLASVAALSLFAWLPLLGSKPIADLPPGEAHVEIPASAKSFRWDHGQIRFSSLGVPGEDPLRFGMLVGFSVAGMLGLVLSFRKS